MTITSRFIRTSRRQAVRAWVGGALLGAAAFSGSAQAHAHLRSAVPPINGTTSKPPSELALTFSEGVNLAFTGVRVSAHDGSEVPTGSPHLQTGHDMVLVVPVTRTLTPGDYKVDWHALATDGHKTNGSYTFTVKP